MGDRGRHKTRHIAAETRDFFHDTRTKISIFLLRHEENCFYTGIEFPVHQRHLKFKFKIRNGAQTADDRSGFFRSGEFDKQSFELGNSHIVDLASGLSQQIQTFLQREKRLLLVIMRHGHNDFIKQFPRTLNDIEVTVRHRIETAGVNGGSHRAQCSIEGKTAKRENTNGGRSLKR